MNINIQEASYHDIPVYQLCCGDMTVCVAPTEGMNICHVQYGNYAIIEGNMERRANGATWGMPILYPTPNRINGGYAHFQGAVLPLFWKGKQLPMHGAARHMAFAVEGTAVCEDHAEITGYVDFTPGTEAHNYFPYASRLSLTVKVYADRVEVTHTVTNKDKNDLGFGLAYHPFFTKHGATRIRTGAKSFYVTDENLLPSGELKPAEGVYDLSKPVDVDSLSLDHVYTNLPKDEDSCEIFYDEIGLHVTLKATEDFTHLVVFTPKQPFFCLENQTCSTDVHNLSREFDHAHLQIVKPGEAISGTVTILAQKM